MSDFMKRIDTLDGFNNPQTYYLINGVLAKSDKGGPLQEPVPLASLHPLAKELLHYQVELLAAVDAYDLRCGALKVARDEFTLKYRIESIFESHWFLRQENMKRNEQRYKEMAEAREIGRQQGYEAVTKGEFFSREDLKKMTLSELTELLQD